MNMRVILHAIAALCALVAWAATVDTAVWELKDWFSDSLTFFVALNIVSWIFSFVMIAYHVMGIQLGWIMEAIFDAVMCFALVAVDSYWANKWGDYNKVVSNSNITAGLVFAFFAAFLWLVDIVLARKQGKAAAKKSVENKTNNVADQA